MVRGTPSRFNALIIAMVLVVSLLLLPSGAAHAAAWAQANRDGFSSGITDSFAMATYNGKLFVGTSGCRVLRFDGPGPDNWTAVNSGGFGDGGNTKLASLTTWSSFLVAGTENAGGCQVWLYNGSEWTRIGTAGLGNAGNTKASSLASLDSTLYAGTSNATNGCQVLQYDGDGAWTQVNLSSFGDSNHNLEALSLEGYDGHLFAGTLHDPSKPDKGTQVWRYDGPAAVDWARVNTAGFGNTENSGTTRMAVFKDRLYAATRNTSQGFELRRYDAPGTWPQIGGSGLGDTDNDAAYGMLSTSSCLWLGTTNFNGCQLFSYDGSAVVCSSTGGFGDAMNKEVYSIGLANGYVLAGTSNSATGSEVWMLPPSAPRAPTPPGLYGSCATRDGKAWLWGRASAFGTGVSVKIFEGSTTVASPAVNDYGNFQVQLTGITDGVHTYHAKTYVWGAESSISNPVTVTAGSGSYGPEMMLVYGSGKPRMYVQPGTLPMTGKVLIPDAMGTQIEYDVNDLDIWFQKFDRDFTDHEDKSILNLSGNEPFSVRYLIPDPNHEVDYLPGTKIRCTSFMTGGESEEDTLADVQGTLGEMVYASFFGNLGGARFVGELLPDFDNQPWTDDVSASLSYKKTGAWPGAGETTIDQQLLQMHYNWRGWPPDRHDPSGFVYDASTGRRIAGAKATCEQDTDSMGHFSAWPAYEYYEENPEYTDHVGHYGWDVTEGDYRVAAEKSGYESTTSPVVHVPPAVLDLNIPLERKDLPYTYYFAEGTTRPGFEEFISLQNPGEEEAEATITYMLGTGENREQKVGVPARSRATVSVNDFLGPDQDVSARVTSDKLIVCERPMYFNYKPDDPQGQWTGGHVVVGAEEAGLEWLFAEGTTRDGFNEWLCIQNPGDAEAQVQVRYMLGDGRNITSDYTVGAKSRFTVNVNGDVGPGQDVSAAVTSKNAVPIVCERPVYFNYQGKWNGGHDVLGSTFPFYRWFFAEGCTYDWSEEWLCVQNPNADAANLTITYMLGSGENKTSEITIDPYSRRTVNVNADVGPDQDVSCFVDSDLPVVCERPMYFDYQGKWNGGHDAMGAVYAKDTYFLAEGCTRDGFDEWICIENPNDADVTVVVDYMLGTGETKSRQVAVPAHSRYTVNVNAEVGAGQDVSARITSTGGRVIVERPMYFSYAARNGLGQPEWTGGHDTVGY